MKQPKLFFILILVLMLAFLADFSLTARSTEPSVLRSAEGNSVQSAAAGGERDLALNSNSGSLSAISALHFKGQDQPEKVSTGFFYLQAYDQGKFVESLTLADLVAALEDQPLNITGLTLVKGLKVKRAEGQEIPSPILPRVIILEFKAYDFHQRMGEVVENLFRRPYNPSDAISLVTPVNIYSFSSNDLRNKTPDELIKAGLTILKRDVSVSGRTENEIIDELTRLILDLQQGSSAKETLTQYQQNLESLKSFRKFNPQTISLAAVRFAELQAIKKYIVVYQQEFLPIPNDQTMDQLLANQGIMFQASELFRSIPSDISVVVDSTIEDLKQASMSMNLIYFKAGPKRRPDIKMRELSVDMFDIYAKLAQATGGLVEASASPAAQLKKILEQTENYYLISCQLPAPELTADQLDESEISGKTEQEIKIYIKNKSYELSYHRL
ncbi:MAG TPA: hypothetical protein PLX40_09305 [Candidatus Saccharicenans sp.]|nr:hypothetical protein [Candidatus Saccharicenans sp.]